MDEPEPMDEPEHEIEHANGIRNPPPEENPMSETHIPEATMNVSGFDPNAAGARQPGEQIQAPPPGTWHPSQRQMFDHRRKSPFLAAVLSVFPGVGQLYIGYYVRGFVIAAVFLLVAVVAAGSREPVGPMLAITAVFLWIFNLIDAGRMAALYNHAAAGADVVELPDDFKVPRMGGSIIGGGFLLLFGGIALSNTLFGLSLDWLEAWWPVFPFAMGAYLFIRGVMDYTSDHPRAEPGRAFDSEERSSTVDD
jgi:hypothetical protein